MDNVSEVMQSYVEGQKDSQGQETYSFNRVDFNDPTTILSYGEDLLNQIAILTKSVLQMMREETPMDPELDEKIKKIGEFSSYLDESEEQKNTEVQKPTRLLALVGKVLNLEPKESLKKPLTYLTQYEKYCGDIEVVAKGVETQKQNTLMDIEMNQALIQKMELCNQQLALLIQVGYQDKKEYTESYLAQLEKQVAQSPSPDLMKQIKLARKTLEVFEKKLIDLSTSLALYKNMVLECQLRQTPNMEFVIMLDSYLKTTIPSLRVQATSMVGVRRQHTAIARYQDLVENTNKALLSNSQMLVDNIQKIGDLQAEGSISMDTLRKMEKEIKKGVDMLGEYGRRQRQAREDSIKGLEEIQKNLTAHGAMLADAFAEGTLRISEASESGKTLIKGRQDV